MSRYVCIHGHFYQPPRENPWLEEVELQDSAHPYHDWNDRITMECYAPNGASRIVDAENRILSLSNNYAKISFNIGPTLCAWMARHRPEVLELIVEADRLSRDAFSGHGSAIAQAYHHLILPLANRRDKETQVEWGIRHFEKTFGRLPEGMWLPETAVDLESLESLAAQGIRYTILAPQQARRIRVLSKGAATEWQDLPGGIETRRSYRCLLPSGKSIALFFFDGTISHDIAFGGLLKNGEAFAKRLLGAFSDDNEGAQLVHVATDGESYGHHHRYGDMALAFCLHTIESSSDVRLTNYGEFLERHPPEFEVEIVPNSSWSCAHGVERWRADCGCNSGRKGWNQAWRKPLREALDHLRDRLALRYEKEAAFFLSHPWRARNCYFNVVADRSEASVDRFFREQASRELLRTERTRVLQLLEMERHCLQMYTSCGWFFDEISGLETVQVLQYAARAAQEAEKIFRRPLEKQLIKELAAAPSNVLGNGARVYERHVQPARLDLLRVGAHQAVFSLFSESKRRTQLYCYSFDSEDDTVLKSGKFRLALGRFNITSTLTGEQACLSFAVLHFGDQNVQCGVRLFSGERPFEKMWNELAAEFERGHMTGVLLRIQKHFGSQIYSLWHLLRDQQRHVLGGLLGEIRDEISRSMRNVYEESGSLINFLNELHHPVPAPLLTVAELVVNSELQEMFAGGRIDSGRLEHLVDQISRWSLPVHKEELRLPATQWVDSQVGQLEADPEDLEQLEMLAGVLDILQTLKLGLDFWKAQNTYYRIGRRAVLKWKEQSSQGEEFARQRLETYRKLGDLLRIHLS